MIFTEKLSQNDNRATKLAVSQDELIVPTDELIALTGYSVEVLKGCGILPQPFGSSYQLVVSDHRSVALKLFESIGVPVVQGNGDAIDRAWGDYLSPSFEGMTEEEIMEEYVRYVAGLVTARRVK